MSKSITFTGTVHQVGKTQTFPSGFSKRMLVLKEDRRETKYDNYLAVEFVKDKTRDLDGLRIGELVEVEFFVNSNENRNKPGQWFTSCRAVAVKRMMTSGPVDIPMNSAPAPATCPDCNDGGDTMPF